MSNAISFGYQRPTSQCVEVIRLAIIVDDEEFNSETTSFPTWDYESTVSIVAEIDVDLERLAKESGYVSFAAEEDFPVFSLLASWSSNKTKQRGSSPRQVLENGRNVIEHEIDNSLLGGELHSALQIDLLKPGVAFEDAVVATRPGSRLWASDVLRVRLEGNSAQMPLIPVNFTDARIVPQHAMWRIDISPDLLRPVQAGMQVYINTGHPLALRMLEKDSGKEKSLWNASLNADVITRMLLHADGLNEIEGLEDNPLFPGSLAESVLNLAQALFPQTPFEDIPADPALVFATSQALAFKDIK
ncbi:MULTISPECIES: hypothetical protein [Corynebacterium]|uniref:hypothetical protein n=1 Tax=Corynebacterium TaxID=1716 RepID=UPI0008A5F8D3|nr:MULTISPECIES: hypothetical protein [Corynebacterium]OFP29917.1 hypothetical protein HMPREF2993_09365 [Corynebacterium sp. HMSC068G04]PMC67714.1 hypothetical protein CJ201_12800 [Corynebacterium aurimucosum]